MCQPVSCQSRFSLIFFVQQEPEPEPRARIRFRFFLGQNDTVPAPVPQHCCAGRVESVYLPNFFMREKQDPWYAAMHGEPCHILNDLFLRRHFTNHGAAWGGFVKFRVCCRLVGV